MARRTQRRGISYSASPLLTSPTPVWRGRLLLAGLAVGFAVLGARAAYVQVVDNAFLQRQGENRFARTLELPANRGRLLDRNGLILATSVPAASVAVDNADPRHPQIAALARLLNEPVSTLRARLQRAGKRYTYLKRHIDESIGQQVKALKIPGVYVSREYRREYPEGPATAHILGFVDIDGNGAEGMERALDKRLRGVPGSRRVIRDRLGRIVEDMRDVVPATNGRDVTLAVDSRVQYVAYDQLRRAVQKHQARAGSAVVLDSQTGEVLALANYPSYDPEDRAQRVGEGLRNRALTDVFEPGSTVKPLMVGLALQQGVVQPQTVFDTAPGRIVVTGRALTDAHPMGELTVREIIQKSSNVGMVKIVQQLPAQAMWRTYTAVGLGQKPRVPFPGVVAGTLRDPEGWRPIDKAVMSYGYGLSASLFQLAQAYTVFATNGELLPVTLLKTAGPVPGQTVFSPHVAQEVRAMLQLAAQEGGTGQRAQTTGYTVAGKTGTARKVVGGQYLSKYRAFFVGVAPAQSPRVVVAVMIDEPGDGKIYGGQVAAPVFSELAQQTLRVLGVTPDATDNGPTTTTLTPVATAGGAA